MKKCKCGETNIKNFYKDKQKTDGLTSRCIKCIKDIHSSYIPSGETLMKKRVYQRSERGYLSREKWRKSGKGQKWLKSRRLSNCITAGMHRSLKDGKDGLHWEDLVDYTITNLKEHLEKQFQAGMTWENHTKDGWHIDHIIPIFKFNITSYYCDDFKKCWDLNNLRPLWCQENQSRAKR